MGVCVAYGCSNNSSSRSLGKVLGFFRFPKEPSLRKQWIRAVRRKHWTPSLNSRLCSDHFSDECLNKTYPSRLVLRDGAVPSIFPAHPPLLQPNSAVKESPVDGQMPLTTKYPPKDKVQPFQLVDCTSDSSEDAILVDISQDQSLESLECTTEDDAEDAVLVDISEPCPPTQDRLSCDNLRREIPTESRRCCDGLRKEIARLQKQLARKSLIIKRQQHTARMVHQTNRRYLASMNKMRLIIKSLKAKNPLPELFHLLEQEPDVAEELLLNDS